MVNVCIRMDIRRSEILFFTFLCAIAIVAACNRTESPDAILEQEQLFFEFLSSQPENTRKQVCRELGYDNVSVGDSGVMLESGSRHRKGPALQLYAFARRNVADQICCLYVFAAGLATGVQNEYLFVFVNFDAKTVTTSRQSSFAMIQSASLRMKESSGLLAKVKVVTENGPAVGSISISDSGKISNLEVEQ